MAGDVRVEVHDLVKAFAQAAKGLQTTVLVGWPHERLPTVEEAQDIQSVHGELSLQEPLMNGHHCWYLAGQIVARVGRDRASRKGSDADPCGHRGPRIGDEGVMYCVLPEGHDGKHEGDPSWKQHGW